VPRRRSSRVGAAAGAADAFEALGDPHRRQILAIVGERPRPVGEIASLLPVTRPAVSWHLRLLKEAGLVSEQRVGTRRIYAIRQEGLDAVADYLEQVWGEAAARFRITAENTRPN
jgi:DNA-binding transcriptional ArsR family regulator